ncbi:MAG TPA: hypothetical protein DCO75_03195 [Fibrobacteres bacterium]|nr:hypothetical protein [Fibrobacterota bacterium]
MRQKTYEKWWLRIIDFEIGRNTDTLDGQGIIRATIDTVAENIADGIVSPHATTNGGRMTANIPELNPRFFRRK